MLSIVENVRTLATRNVGRFHLSSHRTGLFQDWVVGFGWEGARSVQGWLVTDKVLTDQINRDAEAMQRRCRRVVEGYGLKDEYDGERGAATELYWAAVAVLKEAGEVEVGVMRRGAKNSAQARANDWGQDTTRDSYWLLKLKEGPLYDSSTTDDDAGWTPPRARVDAQSGILAVDLYELRRRFRSVGADPLAQPDAQIHRTNAQLAHVLRESRNDIPHRKGLIALSVEIAAGRITTEDGLPSAAEVRHMTHGSKRLPWGSFGLTVAQAEVIEGLRSGHRMWLDWPALEDRSVVPLHSKYRHVPILATRNWRQHMQWKTVKFEGNTDAKLAVAAILNRIEQPFGSIHMKIDSLRRKLAASGLVASEWDIFCSCLCMEGFMVRKHTGNATNSKHANELPVRGCCKIHGGEKTFANCGLFYPPDAQYEGRHENDMGQYRKRPGEDDEQAHVVGQQAQLALIIAEFHHCSDMVKARMVNVDICSGTQSQAHSNLRLGGITTLSYDKRSEVEAFGAVAINTPLDASVSLTSTYIAVATDMHSRKMAMARVATETLTSDCKSTSTTSAHLYRFPDSSPLTDDDGELTEHGEVAAEADAVLRYSMMHMASIQSDRRRLLSVTEDYG